MFFRFDILAAAIGTVFEKRALSRIALAERQIGGRRMDIASEDASIFWSYTIPLASTSNLRSEGTNLHGFIAVFVMSFF
jgi:hypothetical protein